MNVATLSLSFSTIAGGLVLAPALAGYAGDFQGAAARRLPVSAIAARAAATARPAAARRGMAR